MQCLHAAVHLLPQNMRMEYAHGWHACMSAMQVRSDTLTRLTMTDSFNRCNCLSYLMFGYCPEVELCRRFAQLRQRGNADFLLRTHSNTRARVRAQVTVGVEVYLTFRPLIRRQIGFPDLPHYKLGMCKFSWRALFIIVLFCFYTLVVTKTLKQK